MTTTSLAPCDVTEGQLCDDEVITTIEHIPTRSDCQAICQNHVIMTTPYRRRGVRPLTKNKGRGVRPLTKKRQRGVFDKIVKITLPSPP